MSPLDEASAREWLEASARTALARMAETPGRWTGNGVRLTVQPLIGGYRLCVGGRESEAAGAFDSAYDYPPGQLETVIGALLDWDGGTACEKHGRYPRVDCPHCEADPPDGWIRHMPSSRRRPDGDPAREYVRR